MNKTYRFVIAHGTTSRPERSWFPWLTWQLLKRGHEVFVPRFPTPRNQSYDSWLNAFYEQVPSVHENTVLIGHSTGAPFLLRFLSESQHQVRALALVSSFARRLSVPEYPDIEPLLYSFVDSDLDWDRIREAAPSHFVVHGEDDPIVPLQEGLLVAENLGIKIHRVKSGGHLNTDAGYTELPMLLEWLEQELHLMAFEPQTL